MAKGKVAWFSSNKGFGFITPEGGKKDVFVHWSGIEGDGYRKLEEGQTVEFEVSDLGAKGAQAVKVRVVEDAKKEAK